MIEIIRDIEDKKEILDGNERRRRSLTALLRPGDVIEFNVNGGSEYLLVKSMGKKRVMVYGDYIDASRKVTRRRMSLDQIARRDSRVAYLQKILGGQ